MSLSNFSYEHVCTSNNFCLSYGIFKNFKGILLSLAMGRKAEICDGWFHILPRNVLMRALSATNGNWNTHLYTLTLASRHNNIKTSAILEEIISRLMKRSNQIRNKFFLNKKKLCIKENCCLLMRRTIMSSKNPNCIHTWWFINFITNYINA